MLYRILWSTLGPLIRLYWRQRVVGRHHVPRDRGAIIASNHVAGIDPIFISMSFVRPVRWLAKIELVRKRRIAWFFRSAMVIAVDRDAPRDDAFEAAAIAIKQGHLVGIFPEGTRSPDGRVYRPYTGVARIAQRSDAPVIPTAVVGADRSITKGSILAKPVKVEVRYGLPMHFAIRAGEDEQRAYRRFSDEVMDAVAMLAGAERVRDEHSRRR